MAEENPKPLRWSGDNLNRYLASKEILLIKKQKQVVLTRIIRRDDFLEQLEKDYTKQTF